MSMRVQLPEKWTEYLVGQPESGMGYQRVDVDLEDGTHLEGCLVFNAEQIEIPGQHAGKSITRVTLAE